MTNPVPRSLASFDDAPDAPFVLTSVAKTMARTVERVMTTGLNGIVFGTAGVGKSRAIQELVERADATALLPPIVSVEVPPTLGANAFELFDLLAEQLGFRRMTSVAALCRAMSRETSDRRLIILDEAQHLKLLTVRELAHVSKYAGHRLILVGNPDVLKLVNTGQAAIQQISGRFPIRETITSIDDDDADLLGHAYGLEELEAFKAIRAIGRKHHARGVVDVLRQARALADAAGSKTIRLRQVAQALDLFPHYAAAPARKAITRSPKA